MPQRNTWLLHRLPRGHGVPGGQTCTLGQETRCTHCWAMCSGGVATTNIPRLYTRAHRTDSYDGEVGSSLTCTLTTYEFGLFSNAPMSLIVADRFNHHPHPRAEGVWQGPCISSGVPLKRPSSRLGWTYSSRHPPTHAFTAVSAAPPQRGRPGCPKTTSFLQPPLA